MPVAKRVAVHINVSHCQSNFPLVIFKKKVSVLTYNKNKTTKSNACNNHSSLFQEKSLLTFTMLIII